MSPIPREASGDLACLALGLHIGTVQAPYEGLAGPWLRWKTLDGVVLPTGEERADTERERADRANERAERLAGRLRAAGLEPE